MADSSEDLISMADIARLAGEKRATVGNWKARNPEEFPRERGRGTRGPLYDRAEVVAWLEATNRLNPQRPNVTALWNLASSLRGVLTAEETMPLLLALLAVKAKAPAQWTRMRAAAGPELDGAVRAAVHAVLPLGGDVLPLGQLPAHALKEVVATLATFDDIRAGELADALLEQAANAMGHRGGEFLTPRSVRKLMVALSEPTGTVYNPATGVAQLMIDAALGASNPVQLFGQEINTRIWAMAQLNLAIHDVEADVALDDVFGADHFPQLLADRVLCVPPWNQKLPIADVLLDDPRWVFGEPGPNDGNAAWTQHCVAHLADAGRAVIVLPNAALFESGRAGRIRQRIIKAGLLDAVVALPAGLFAWTALPCSVLVFAKGRKSVHGKPAPTLMVDVTEQSEPQSRRSVVLTDQVINRVARLYTDWAQGKQPTGSDVAVATFDDLAANEFVIDPGRYLALPSTTSNLGEATRARTDLVDRLEQLTQESRDADAHLQSILRGSR